MEELFLTCGTLEGKMTLVFLHMVVHRVLLLLGHLADGTNEMTIRILLVFHRHGYRLLEVTQLQFYRLRVEPLRPLLGERRRVLPL